MSTKEISVPKHVGLILDGNRRWARAHGLMTLEGHRRGYENLKTVTKSAFNNGVSYVSAYIFSTENWSRSADEVKYLMNLAQKILTKDVEELHKEGVKVVWLGSRQKISEKLLSAIAAAENLTKNNTRGTLALCFNYGGQEELVEATRKIITSGIKAEDVTVKTLDEALYAPEVPPLDLIIRTSGEQRLSGFMMYRAAYAELYFTSTYWPEFSEQEFLAALAEYARRDRRNGA